MMFLELREAIEAQDLELLERAVDMVESRGYAHRLSAELKEAKDLIARLKRLQKLIHEVYLKIWLYKSVIKLVVVLVKAYAFNYLLEYVRAMMTILFTYTYMYITVR